MCLLKFFHRTLLQFMFEVGSQHVSYFLHGKLELIDNKGASHVHMLIFEPILNSLRLGITKDCLDKAFVKKLNDCPYDRFTKVLNAQPNYLFEKIDIGDSPIID
jgi:hypothetical protein